MTCSTTALGIPIPLTGTTLSVSIETLSTAMSLITAYVYYDKWKDDKDNLKDLANRYVAVGEEYCAAADVLRTKTNTYYDYVTAFPEYTPTTNPSRDKYFDVLRKASEAAAVGYTSIPSDDTGARCTIRYETAKAVIANGSAAIVDGTRYERGLTDKYLASRLQANTNALQVQPPNNANAFELVGTTVAKQAESDMMTMSSALYMVGRGVSYQQQVGF
ncbi:MAG: hypothetical protein BWK73_20195 [Thiothrix lacustris]|uniref:Uncharacterized protein n=1 Tax=Thiothrix lacustris TaxID=525917 RepID=A0A1Y1QP60_9GAMM|nr:MAG: hypothetical protein BWK73_20195 [Thiothrix lacustris]